MRSHSCSAYYIAIVLALCGPGSVWAQARERLLQSIDVQAPVAPLLVRIAGKQHAAYELHMTNFTNAPIELTRIEIDDPERNARVAEFSGAALADTLGRAARGSDVKEKRILGPGERAISFLWLALDESAAAPARLAHRIELALLRPAGREQTTVRTELQVQNEAPTVLDPPVRGGPWVALYDPSMARGHRTSVYTLDGRARIPARFAIDWILLDENAAHASGDATIAANWHGYAAEVLAVADATVVHAEDTMPSADSVGASQGPIALDEASGNYVTLDLGDGQYAFYEHLQHGSIRVKAGDRVKSGQLLGLLGNSGSSSSGPHLHFHLADAPSTLAAEGLPYVFKSFEVVGAFEHIGDFARAEPWKSLASSEGGKRERELPDANVVVMFPTANGQR